MSVGMAMYISICGGNSTLLLLLWRVMRTRPLQNNYVTAICVSRFGDSCCYTTVSKTDTVRYSYTCALKIWLYIVLYVTCVVCFVLVTMVVPWDTRPSLDRTWEGSVSGEHFVKCTHYIYSCSASWRTPVVASSPRTSPSPTIPCRHG